MHASLLIGVYRRDTLRTPPRELLELINPLRIQSEHQKTKQKQNETKQNKTTQ